MTYCCDIFEKAVEKEDCILLIDEYRDHDDSWDNTVMKPLERGYYIIDSWQSEEMGRTNYPAMFNKLKYCPWCGKTIDT